MGRLTTTILLLSLAMPCAGDDHGEVRELRETHQILPLQRLLERLPAGERVLEAELEHSNGRYRYEIEVLDATGRVHEYRFDAHSGKRLTTDGDD